MSQVWKACSLGRAYEGAEAEGNRAHGEGESLPHVGGDSVDAGEEGSVSDEGVVALGCRCLGVPGAPDAGGEVVGGVPAGQAVVESSVHDDGARPDVGEHVGPVHSLG